MTTITRCGVCCHEARALGIICGRALTVKEGLPDRRITDAKRLGGILTERLQIESRAARRARDILINRKGGGPTSASSQ